MQRAVHLPLAPRRQLLSFARNGSEVREKKMSTLADQDVLRLEITVDEVDRVVQVVDGGRDLVVIALNANETSAM